MEGVLNDYYLDGGAERKAFLEINIQITFHSSVKALCLVTIVHQKKKYTGVPEMHDKILTTSYWLHVLRTRKKYLKNSMSKNKMTQAFREEIYKF
jgi:hypothetical protein